MGDDSDFDESAHELLLKSVSTGKVKRTPVRRKSEKVTADELLQAISTKKKSEGIAVKARDNEVANDKKGGSAKTLAAPIHRQERERIQGAAAYIELKKDLHVWKDVVDSNRHADQLQFPLHHEYVLSVDTGADLTDSFRPKTEMEIEMANLLNNSKHNLKNDTQYTEAELEIIKAMDLKEAKSKLAAMQKMRAIISYREAKYRRDAKIKSKGYHRILKRQRRKQLVKEFDELLVRDPEAAKEKLKEIEAQRVLERGALKHHARSKFQREIIKHAGRDPAAKKILEENLRLGRELKEKVSLDSDSENESEEQESKRQSVSEMIKNAAMAAAQESELDQPVLTPGKARQQLFELRAKKRAELANARVLADGSVGGKQSETAVFAINEDWATSKSPQTTTDSVQKKDKKKRKVTANLSGSQVTISNEVEINQEQSTSSTIDQIFDGAEQKLISQIQKEASAIKKLESLESAQDDDEPKTKKKKKKGTTSNSSKATEVDISLDPQNFLQLETSNIAKVSADLVEKMEEFDESQERIVAEAFQDDDVIGDFDAEKEIVEFGEKPKDVDLTLQGWGCWAGPGITEKARRKCFIIKAKEKRRRDAGKKGVIISESSKNTLKKLQPAALPFPYTRVVDFEAVTRQPVGKDWNPASVTRDLCKPSVVTQGGRTIRPLNKEEALKKKFIDAEDVLL